MSPPVMRRLAPQRKKATAVVVATSSPSANELKKNNNLPINISSADDDDDEDADIMLFDDNQLFDGANDGIEGDNGIATARHIADWTNQALSAQATARDVISVDESSVHEEDEKEYHGEIDSVASNNSQLQNDDEDKDEDKEEIFHIKTENEISLNPPPQSTPYVLVNLQELCGYTPDSDEEKLILVDQMMEALLGNKDHEDDARDDGCGRKAEEDNGEENEEDKGNNGASTVVLGDGLSLDFDERMSELFDSGAAFHVDSTFPIAMSCLGCESEKTSKHNDDDDDKKITTAESGGSATTKKKEVSPYAVIPYPEFLSSTSTSISSTTLQQPTAITTRSTVRLWKLLYTTPTCITTHPQIHPLLTKLFTHLRNTSRSLLWKADMHTELCHLSKSEYTNNLHRTQANEYKVWKESVRKERLDKLYDVRDTFMVRVDVAKKRYGMLVEEREGRVEKELGRRGLLGDEIRSSGVQQHASSEVEQREEDRYDNNDLNNNDDAEEDDGWGGTICEDDILGEETSIGRRQFEATIQEDYDEDNEEGNGRDEEWAPLETNVNPLGMNIAVDGITANDITTNTEPERDEPKSVTKPISNNKLEPISHDDNNKRKSDRMQKKRDRMTPSSSSSPSSSTTMQQSSEWLLKEQESIRDMLKTNDERIAEATLLKLEERLKTVDDLLESLQEEEWADEEEDEEGGHGNSFAFGSEEDGKEQAGFGPTRPNPFEATLLDQILAMILGGLPKEKDASGKDVKTSEEHYRYIRDEHKSIVKEWLEVFGRMPPFPTPEPESQKTAPFDDELPFGDSFIPSETRFGSSTVTTDISGGAVKKDLQLIPNDDNNWDDVEDWDAIFPS